MSQLPKLPWPLCRFVNGTAAGTAPTGRSGAPLSAAAPASVEVSVVEDRLRVEGPRLESVLAAVESHLGVQVELVRCERTVKGGLRGFFGREHFIVEARRQGSGTVAPVGRVPAGPASATAAGSTAATSGVDVDDEGLVVEDLVLEVPAAEEPAVQVPLDGSTFADALARALEELDADGAAIGDPEDDLRAPAASVVTDPVFLALDAEPPVDTVETSSGTTTERRGLRPPRSQPEAQAEAGASAGAPATHARAGETDEPSVADLLLALLAERAEVLDLREVDHDALDRIADLIAPLDPADAAVSADLAESARSSESVESPDPAESFQPAVADQVVAEPGVSFVPAAADLAAATGAGDTWACTPGPAPALPRLGVEPSSEPAPSFVPPLPPLPRLEATSIPARAESAAASLSSSPPPASTADQPSTPPVSAGEQLRRTAAQLPFDDVVAAVRRLVGPVPSLPDAGIVAVVGEHAVALRAAQMLARQAGEDPGDVVVVSPTPVEGHPPWMSVTSIDELELRRSRWIQRERATFVAVELVDGHRWAQDALDELSPAQTRLAVAGATPAIQVEPRLHSLGSVQVIDLIGAAEVGTSITFLDLDVPVATVDGFAATYEAWARWLHSVVPPARSRRHTGSPPTAESALQHRSVPTAPPALPPEPALRPRNDPTAPPAVAPESAPTRHRRRHLAPVAPRRERPVAAASAAAAAAGAGAASWSSTGPSDARTAVGSSLAVAVLDRPPPGARGPDVLGHDARGPDVRGPDVRGPDVRGPDVRGPDVRGPDPRTGRPHDAASPSSIGAAWRVLPGGRSRRLERTLTSAIPPPTRVSVRRTITSPSFPVVESARRAPDAPDHRNDP